MASRTSHSERVLDRKPLFGGDLPAICHLIQRLRQISQNIVNMLDPHREPYIALGNAGITPVLGIQLRMCCRRWMNGKRPRITDIRHVIKQL